MKNEKFQMIGITQDDYKRLKQAKEKTGKPMKLLITDALDALKWIGLDTEPVTKKKK